MLDKLIDLRSDTVTMPCQEMRNVMAQAQVGDDVYGEDPTINKLEELAAKKMGKEAALFVTSGTMGNQVAVLTHTSRGDEVILEENSHINSFEVGGIAVLAGVMPKPLKGSAGKINSSQVQDSIKAENIHYPKATLLCLENTSNFGGGTVYSPEEMSQLAKVAKENGLRVHVDGARIFNGAVSLKIPACRLIKDADSVMFCLSKGLGAPVGSILVGSRDFITKARKYRKMLGGGLRQGGILAAAGIYALENLIDRLAEDHDNAKSLAYGLKEIPGLAVDLNIVQTNIVMVDIDKEEVSSEFIINKLKEKGILVNSVTNKRLRFVTHRGINEEDIDYTIGILKEILS